MSKRKEEKSRSWLAVIAVLLLLLLLLGAFFLWYFWGDLRGIFGPGPGQGSGIEVEVDPDHIVFGDKDEDGDGPEDPPPEKEDPPAEVRYTVDFDVDYLAHHGGLEIEKTDFVEFRTDKAEYLPGETVHFEGKILGGATYYDAVFSGVEGETIVFSTDTDFYGEFTMPEQNVVIKFEVI